MNMTVTKSIYDYIFQHLTQFHSNKMRIVNNFISDYDEYMQMLSFMKDYINQCERLLGDIDMADGDDELPFVIFNCIVRLSSDYDDDWSCCVTLPKEEYENSLLLANVTPIPCNTSEAYELILKKSGDRVVIEKNGKSNTYTVKRIEANPYIPLVEFDG